VKALMEAGMPLQGKLENGQVKVPRRSFASALLWKLGHGLVENDISRLQVAFQHIDSDNTGKISFYNFQSVMKQLGYELSREKLKKKFDQMDDKGIGEVSFEEFVRFMVIDKNNKDAFKHLLTKRATFIYNEFVSPSAPRQVNIQGPTRKHVKEDIESGNITLSTFDKAEHEILALLSTDTFARFKQSQLFQQFLDSASTYTHVRKSNDKEVKSKGGKAKRESVNGFRSTLENSTTGHIKHGRNDSISIDSLMKTLGTDDIFAIRVGGLGRARTDTTDGSVAIPEKPVSLSSLTETEEREPVVET